MSYIPSTPEEVMEVLDDAKGLYRAEFPDAYGIGLATLTADDRIVAVDYCNNVNYAAHNGVLALIAKHLEKPALGSGLRLLEPETLLEVFEILEAVRGDGLEHPNLDVIEAVIERFGIIGNGPAYLLPSGYREVPILCVIDSVYNEAVDAADALLRLELLSRSVITPRCVELRGSLEVLENVVWTNYAPVLVEDFDSYRLDCIRGGERSPLVYAAGPIPPMTNYVVPEGMQISEPARTLLGTYLGEEVPIMSHLL